MLYVAWVVLRRNRHIGASERRQLIPHVRFQVPFLGPESQLKSGFACAGLLCSAEPTRSLEEEARDILATAAKNQAEDGPNTRRAAVRACKCLRAMVNQYGSIIQEVHKAALIHTQLSKGTAGSTTQYRPQGGELPVISPERTSEPLHCLPTLPDPWPLAKIAIDIEKLSQWVSKLCRLYFADEYARRTVGVPSATQALDMRPRSRRSTRSSQSSRQER